MAHYAFRHDAEYVTKCVECDNVYAMPGQNICSKNHRFCDFCYENVYRLTGCDICHRDGSNDGFYTKPMYHNPHGCRSQGRGCTFVSEDEDVLQRHSDGCKDRIVNCEVHMFGLTTCYWVGGIVEIPAHFEEEHPENYKKILNNTLVIAKFNLSKEQSSVHLIEVDDELFYYKHKLDLRKGKFYVSVQMVNLEEIANKYFFKYFIKNGDLTMNMLEMCHSDGMSDDQIFDTEMCTVIPVKTLKKYVNNDQLFFEFKIYNVMK